MTDEPPIGEELLAGLDEQALALLKRLKDESTLEGEQRLSVQDHVRGFTAVTDYVETRQKIAPPEKGKSRIEEMRERLSSEPPRRQRRSGGSSLPSGVGDAEQRPNGRAAGGGGSPAAQDAPPPFDDSLPV